MNSYDEEEEYWNDGHLEKLWDKKKPTTPLEKENASYYPAGICFAIGTVAFLVNGIVAIILLGISALLYLITYYQNR